MENIDNLLELKKEEWKKSIEETKELGIIDTETLDVMAALLDGIRIHGRNSNKSRNKHNGKKKNL